jgi:hypothetical protein
MGPDKMSDELASRRLPLVVAAVYGTAGGWKHSEDSLEPLVTAINYARLGGKSQILVECHFHSKNMSADDAAKFESDTQAILEAIALPNEEFKLLALKPIVKDDDIYLFTITCKQK